ncbi:kmo, partial [Symbiodinium necroappetens]
MDLQLRRSGQKAADELINEIRQNRKESVEMQAAQQLESRRHQKLVDEAKKQGSEVADKAGMAAKLARQFMSNMIVDISDIKISIAEPDETQAVVAAELKAIFAQAANDEEFVHGSKYELVRDIHRAKTTDALKAGGDEDKEFNHPGSGAARASLTGADQAWAAWVTFFELEFADADISKVVQSGQPGYRPQVARWVILILPYEIGFKGFLVTCGFGDDVDTLARCSEKRLRELWSLLGITCRYGVSLQLLQILFNQQDQHTIVSLKFGEEGSADFVRASSDQLRALVTINTCLNRESTRLQ